MGRQADLAGKIQRVASACDYANECCVGHEQVGGLVGESLTCSVSQLQEYAACPYRYFARYGLRLQERPEFELAAVELGSFYHRILYKLGTRIRRAGQSLGTIRQEILDRMVSETTDEELQAVAAELPLAGGREQYLLERAKVDIGAAVRGHVGLWRASQFEPALLEACFGMKDGLPALEVDTPKGRRAVLRGKIDRIDIANVDGQRVLAVIDYKRSSRYKFRLDQALAGLQVQLIAYVKAATMAGQAGKIEGGAAAPAGMYYFNLLPEWEKVAPHELLDPAKGQDEKVWQAEGVHEFGLAGGVWGWPGRGRSVADRNVLEQGWPPERRTPAGDSAEFHNLVEHVWRQMGETVDRILDGEFDIQPYRMGQQIACTYCVYDDVCRFGPPLNRYREVERCGTRDLLERLNSGEAGGVDSP